MLGPVSCPALQRECARRQRGTAPSCRGAAQPPGHLLPLLPSPSLSHALFALPTTLLIMALKGQEALVAVGGVWGGRGLPMLCHV